MIYTIGHSTLSIEDFLRVIQPVATVIDVRSHPASKWPQFRKEELEVWLPEHGKGYEWWPGLGGWTEQHAALATELAPLGVDVLAYSKGKFPKQRIARGQPVSETQQEFVWTNTGLYDYSYFMAQPEFIEAADRLIERGRSQDLGIMCCECLPWKCHRSMIADYLAFRGVESTHLQPKLKPHSAMLGNRLDRYAPAIRRAWTLAHA